MPAKQNQTWELLAAETFLQSLRDEDPDAFWTSISEASRALIMGCWLGDRSIEPKEMPDGIRVLNDHLRGGVLATMADFKRGLAERFGLDFLDRAGAGRHVFRTEDGVNAYITFAPVEKDIPRIVQPDEERLWVFLVQQLEGVSGPAEIKSWRVDYIANGYGPVSGLKYDAE
jgi:hypothetical protein